MKTKFILAAALSVLAFNAFAGDGFDRQPLLKTVTAAQVLPQSLPTVMTAPVLPPLPKTVTAAPSRPPSPPMAMIVPTAPASANT